MIGAGDGSITPIMATSIGGLMVVGPTAQPHIVRTIQL